MQRNKVKILEQVKGLFPLFFVSVLLVYGVIQVYLYTLPAKVPDEVWFLTEDQDLSERPFYHLLDAPNLLGYGSLYWIIGGGVNNLLALRILALIYMFSIPIFIALIGRRITQSWASIYLAVLLWITFPAAWWYGKLIGPELFSAFLGLLGVYLSLYKNKLKWIGFAFISMATGIKLYMGILMLFSLVYQIPAEKLKIKEWRSLLKERLAVLFYFGLSCLIGFIVATPYVLLHPVEYIKNISVQADSFYSLYSLRRVFYTLYNVDWEWDSVFRGGLLNLSVGVLPFLIFLFYCKSFKLKDKKLLIAILIPFIASLFLFLNAYLGWYWYSFMGLIPLVIFAFEPNRIFIKTLAVIIVANAFVQYPLIETRINLRLEHAKLLRNKDKIRSCIDKEIDGSIRVYDTSDFGLYTENPLKQDFSDFVSLMDGKVKSPALILLGNRVARTNSRLQLHHLLPNLQKESNVCVTYEKNCGGINILRVEKCK